MFTGYLWMNNNFVEYKIIQILNNSFYRMLTIYILLLFKDNILIFSAIFHKLCSNNEN